MVKFAVLQSWNLWHVVMGYIEKRGKEVGMLNCIWRSGLNTWTFAMECVIGWSAVFEAIFEEMTERECHGRHWPPDQIIDKTWWDKIQWEKKKKKKKTS